MAFAIAENDPKGSKFNSISPDLCDQLTGELSGFLRACCPHAHAQKPAMLQGPCRTLCNQGVQDAYASCR